MARFARTRDSIGLISFLLAAACSNSQPSQINITATQGGGTSANTTGAGSTPVVSLGSGGSTNVVNLGTSEISVLAQTCGNSQKDANEQCDDGNKDGGDGCTKLCQIEVDWICPELGKPCVSSAICGDGKLSSVEACDDGNTDGDDGCSGDCNSVDEGWQCRVPGKRCVPRCGDSQMKGGENCDDGNDQSGDGCSSTCLTEPGYSCSGSPSTCKKSVCGNGEVEAGEGCDNGENDNGLFYGDGQGCSKTCSKEPNCRPDGKTQACTTACGDGNRDPGEDCDDGNAVSGDGCSDQCRIEDGFTCNDETIPDTQDCPSASGKKCLVLPVIYRDFDGGNVNGGHPDFFYLGKNDVTCVPNASGSPAAVNGTECTNTDSTEMCKDLVKKDLGSDGKPQLNTGRSDGLKCACRFTDWDNTGIISNANPENCTEPQSGNSYKRVGYGSSKLMVQVIKNEDSFNQWYHDSSESKTIKGTLELASSGTNQYRFSSSIPGDPAGATGRTVYDDLHDICLASNHTGTLKTGFFPLEDSDRAKVCNIWPYWTQGLQSNCCAGSGCPVTSQWDPEASYDNCPTEGTGGPVPRSDGTGGKVNGILRNFYFTTEVRYLFRYDAKAGGGTLAFFGDDDVWVFINGKLALDLGAPHERLEGSVAVNANTYGLEDGKVYEIAIFHADRHPRESNYQLTVSGFSTIRTSCAPRCGDGVVTAGEECDEGDDGNSDDAYAGCNRQCKYGPFCGDGEVNGEEQCDNGSENGAPYGTENGCTNACEKVHVCGDNIIDSAFGEECDGGTACDKTCHLILTLL